ncbi:MAG: aminotransferase class V-fold PLP-dependent enzyme [Planctomycetota bacterium]|jgi:cysteine desulfurase family protein (TIGR01976 family)
MGIDREAIRKRFPALSGREVFLDNAGGSQLPDTVIERVRRYMVESFVQVGADYEASRVATGTVERARGLITRVVNGEGRGKVVLGPSTSALVNILADCYARDPDPERDEIVVEESGHEANVGPWVRLERRGFRIRWWKLDPERQLCPVEALKNLLSERTRLVAMCHVSNLLGEVEDVAEVCRLAHGAGARVVADGVAYAPHRSIDVAAWDADWYVFSTYKMYGPHMAALYGKDDAFAGLEGPNHFFVDASDVPYKFELGGVLHEGCAGLVGLEEYLAFLAGGSGADRAAIAKAFGVMSGLEMPLQEKLVDYLKSKTSVRFIGPVAADASRVPTISFVHASKSSREIVLAANEQRLGIRYGHFYAHRLCTALGLAPDDGVVRTSMVHYNSPAEIDRLIAFFEKVL